MQKAKAQRKGQQAYIKDAVAGDHCLHINQFNCSTQYCGIEHKSEHKDILLLYYTIDRDLAFQKW